MAFRPISTAKIYMQVIAQIHQGLAAGELVPGQRLPPERELAALLGVSRGSVRQALGALEAMGVVQSRPGDGTFIVPAPREQLLAILDELRSEETWDPIALFEPRRLLEPHITALAAQRASPADLAELERIVAQAELKAGRRELSMEEDLAFHLAIARANHNEATWRLMQRVADMMQRRLWELYKRLALREAERWPHYVEHRRIFEAIRDRDADRARQAMLEHLLASEKRMREVEAELQSEREE